MKTVRRAYERAICCNQMKRVSFSKKKSKGVSCAKRTKIEHGEIAADDAAADRLALALTSAARAVAAGSREAAADYGAE
jgi:hypothetical protein